MQCSIFFSNLFLVEPSNIEVSEQAAEHYQMLPGRPHASGEVWGAASPYAPPSTGKETERPGRRRPRRRGSLLAWEPSNDCALEHPGEEGWRVREHPDTAKSSGNFARMQMLSLAFQVVLVAKNPLASAGDMRDRGLIARSGRSLGEDHSNPLQYSGLENPMDRGAWWATVQRVAESRTRLMRLSMHAAEHGFELRFHHLLTAYFISGKLLDLLELQLPHWCPGNKVLPQNLPILLNVI